MAGKSTNPTDHSDKLVFPIPPIAKRALMYVYSIGAKRYGRNDYLSGKMDWHRVEDALERHWCDWQGGETYCPDDGQHHLASVAWCALTLLTYELCEIGTDTRVARTSTGDVEDCRTPWKEPSNGS